MLVATLLALSAACLHAGWNLVVKTSGDRELAAWGQFLVGGVLFVPVLFATGLPSRGAWPYLIASAIIHVAYVEGLVRAYHHGDFSFAYPLSRGTGAIGAAIGGSILLGDRLGGLAWGMVALIACGLMSFVRPSTSRASLVWAAATGLVIATYTVVDTAGTRRSTNGFAYGVTLTILAAIALSIVGISRGRGAEFVASFRTSWTCYVVSGLCLTTAYSFVLIAVRRPGVALGYVANQRSHFCSLSTRSILLAWAEAIASALAYAHERGVLHLDVKPANILIDHYGKAWLSDFNISFEKAAANPQGLFGGTDRYMSPERLACRPCDDQHALRRTARLRRQIGVAPSNGAGALQHESAAALPAQEPAQPDRRHAGR